VIWDSHNALLIAEGEFLYFIDVKLFGQEDSDLLKERINSAQVLNKLEKNHNCVWDFYTDSASYSNTNVEGCLLRITAHGKISQIC